MLSLVTEPVADSFSVDVSAVVCGSDVEVVCLLTSEIDAIVPLRQAMPNVTIIIIIIRISTQQARDSVAQ